jgi:taurine dioxygenase
MAHGKVGMAADVSVLAMTADLGAEIRGVDLSMPLSDACFRRIEEVFHRYCVIFLRDQRLDPRLLVRFAARFGEVEAAPAGEPAIPGLPQVAVISDLHRDAHGSGSARYGTHWRSDASYRLQPPAATLLYAVQCPAHGGGMEFVNQYAVYDALPRTQRLFVEKLQGVHARDARCARLRPGVRPPPAAADAGAAEHPLVRTHPRTGRKALFAGKDMVSRIPGLAPAEGRKLLDELEAFATQPRFIYSHPWRQGDLIVWDNRCTLHRPTAFDRRLDRVLHRVQVKGEMPANA